MLPKPFFKEQLNSIQPRPNMYTGLKVCGMIADRAACGHYRVINPLQYLQKYGATVLLTDKVNKDILREANIVIAQRQYSKDVANYLIQDCLRAGKLVIFEADDNFHSVVKSSPVYKYYHNGTEELKTLTQLIAATDGLTVSTLELAGDYSSAAKTVEVLPNAIDFSLRDWEYVPDDKDRDLVYIMFTGGSTHSEDIPVVMPTMREILNKYSHVRLVLYTAENIVEEIMTEYCIDHRKVEILHPLPFQLYPKLLGWADIAIVPLANNRFNAAKSNLKYIEFGAKGIPGIFSKVAPYARSVRHGVNGMLASSPPEWKYALEKLIEDRELGKKLGAAAKEDVRENYDLEKLVHLWPTAWENIYKVKTGLAQPRRFPITWGKIGRNDTCPCGCGKKYKKCESYPAWGV